MSKSLSDTPIEIEREWRARLNALSVAERWRHVGGLNNAARTLALSDLRQSYPSASEGELRARLAHRLYGRELAEQAFGPLGEDQEPRHG